MVSWRSIAAGALLLSEYLLLSLCFDAHSVISRGGWWEVYSRVGTAGLIVVLGCLVTVRFLPRHLINVVAATGQLRLPLLALHGVCYSVLLALTWGGFGRVEAPPGPALLWMLAWLLAACATVFTLLKGLIGFRTPRLRVSLGMAVAIGAAGLIAWLAGRCAQLLWASLSQVTLASVAAALTIAFPGQVRGPEGAIIGLREFAVRVDPVCSGFEGMGLATVLTVVFWLAFRRDLRFPNAYGLLPIAVGLAWLGNVLRIILLLILGAFVSPGVAVGAFHSKAGWIVFCVVVMLVVSLGRGSRFFSRLTPIALADDYENPTAAFVAPLVVLVSIALITEPFSNPHDRWYVLRIVGAGITLFAYRRYYRELKTGWSPLPLIVGGLVALLWLVVPGPPLDPLQIDAAGRGAGVTWLAFRAVGSVTVVPIAEELAFRGFLLRRIVARDFTSVSPKTVTPVGIAISSLIFGVLHQRWAMAMIAGTLFAVVQIRTGRTRDAIVSHAFANLVIAGWVLFTRDFGHWVL